MKSSFQRHPQVSTAQRIVVLYSIFSALSIIVNLGLQKFYIAHAPSTHAVQFSVVLGTAGGLITKFLLDKFFVFQYKHSNVSHGISSFINYAASGIVTTAIFWGAEYVAAKLSEAENIRLIGGMIGLTVGYILKYRIDKKIAFSDKNQKIEQQKCI